MRFPSPLSSGGISNMKHALLIVGSKVLASCGRSPQLPTADTLLLILLTTNLYCHNTLEDMGECIVCVQRVCICIANSHANTCTYESPISVGIWLYMIESDIAHLLFFPLLSIYIYLIKLLMYLLVFTF